MDVDAVVENSTYYIVIDNSGQCENYTCGQKQNTIIFRSYVE